MPLDKIDKQIIDELYKSGRKSLLSLSRIITKSNREKMSHAGISKRISKLEETNILKIQGNLNVGELNYKIAFILMEMENYEKVKNIVDAYSECPRIFLLAHVRGQYNLIMGIIGQNMDVLHRYINYCGPTNKKGILHSAVIFASELLVPNFLPLNLFSGISKEYKCNNVCKSCEALLDGKCSGCGNF
ncbi:MAG: Lrp/AsnC family transcriptional regulator [Candidatus Thorarchaeota archaeon]